MSDETDERDDAEDAAPGASAVDPKVHRKARNRKKREEQGSLEFWRNVFATEQGRREMWRLLSSLHPFDTQMSVTPIGMADERGTWMRLGEQLAGINTYQRWFAIAPEYVLLMREENDPVFAKPKGS